MPSNVGNITNVHTLSHIKCGAAGATILSQLSNVSASPGIDLRVLGASGDVFPRFVGPQSQSPEFRFDTTQLLTLCNLLETLLDSTGAALWDGTANPAYLYFEKSLNLAVRAGAGVHTTLTMAAPLIICNQITAGHRTPAVASCRLVNKYDGTTVPIAVSGTASMGDTKTNAEHYVLGGISIGGSFLTDGIQDVTIDFGIQFFGGENGLGADGTNGTTFWGVNTLTPVITVRTHNLGWLAYGLNGSAQTDVIVYLRKILSTGPDVDANSTAISFTGTAGFISVDDTAGGGQDAALSTIRFTQTAALAVDTADDITAA